MKKQNEEFSIKYNVENFKTYILVLEALGYDIYEDSFKDIDDEQEIRNKYVDWDYLVYPGGTIQRGGREKINHFKNIEEFLIWYYTDEEDPKQKEIRELKEKLDQHKKTMLELENKINSLS